MTTVLVTNGQVVTQNPARDIIESGAVVVVDDTIEAVGPASELEADHDPDRIIDADGGAIIPGLINAHTHVSDILLRGSFAADRGLYDWLFNVKRPGSLAMTPEEHAIAASLYCAEAIRSGVTTFVENDTELTWESWDPIEAKLDVYERSGIRSIYGAGFADKPPDDSFETLIEDIQARNPDTEHVAPDRLTVATERALDQVESVIETYHGSADGRQSIWPSPSILASSSSRGLQEAYRLAEQHDVMTTTHVAESEVDARDDGLSSIEYLRNLGYLGNRALLGHCVQIDGADVRLLADTGTAVAHNYMANMRLATGFAPVVPMLENGVTVGLGTDNSILSDTINPLSDVRAAAAGHKGYHRDPDVLPAQTVFDMVTIAAATAIRRDADLGSIEPGKQADIAIVDLDHPHLTPCPDPVFALVYGAQGFEIETVLCQGDVVMENRDILTFDESTAEIMSAASAAAAAVVDRVGIE
ncbi:MAG: amidohydrolase [Halovenus sp.]